MLHGELDGVLWKCKVESLNFYGIFLSPKTRTLRTILISGANRGIGRSIAEKALKEGHRLSLGIRDIDSLKGTKLDPSIAGPERVLISHYEAKDPEKAKTWVNLTLDHFDEFDTIISCAGIFSRANINCSNEQLYDFKDLWEVNSMGPLILVRSAWNELLKKQNGRIIVLVSQSGKRSKGT